MWPFALLPKLNNADSSETTSPEQDSPDRIVIGKRVLVRKTKDNDHKPKMPKAWWLWILLAIGWFIQNCNHDLWQESNNIIDKVHCTCRGGFTRCSDPWTEYRMAIDFSESRNRDVRRTAIHHAKCFKKHLFDHYKGHTPEKLKQYEAEMTRIAKLPL